MGLRLPSLRKAVRRALALTKGVVYLNGAVTAYRSLKYAIAQTGGDHPVTVDPQRCRISDGVSLP